MGDGRAPSASYSLGPDDQKASAEQMKPGRGAVL